MADSKQTENPAPADQKPKPDAKAADPRQTQIDEAKDEGAGNASVPVDQVTTANDK